MHRSRVDAFRHRAAAIIADHAAASHVYLWLTLIGPVIARSTCDEAIQTFRAALDCFASLAMTTENQNACRATKVIRHGLWPMLRGARDAVNPAAASLATISASL
jgi:hypothetical protein